MKKMKIKTCSRAKKYNATKTKNQKEVVVLTPSQRENIDLIDNPRNRGILTVLLHTGLRINELCNLNYGDVFHTGLKTVKDTISVTGKGNKSRNIPLNVNAKKAIRAIDRYNRSALHAQSINQRWPLIISRQSTRLSDRQIRAICEAEIDSHPHILRHTFATDLVEKGESLKTVQYLLGHSKLSTTEEYYLSVTNEMKARAVKKLETSEAPHLKVVNIAS